MIHTHRNAAPFPPAGSAIEERFAQVDGHRMRYLHCGAGPAVVLVHGLLGYSFCWRCNMEALGRSASVYALDLLGLGFGDRPSKLDCSLEASARRLSQFMDAAGIGEAVLVGSSHGGAVCYTAAALEKGAGRGRVRGLVLAAPVTPWSEERPRKAIQLFTSPLGGFLARRLMPLEALHAWGVRRMYGDLSRMPAGTTQGYAAALRQPGSVDYLLRIIRGWRSDLDTMRAALELVRGIPALVLWGSRDAAVLPSSAEPLRQALGGCELVVLDGVGHLPAEESPEEFNRAVAGFVTSVFVSREILRPQARPASRMDI